MVISISKMTSEAEEAARQNNIKTLHDNIRLLTNNFKTSSRPVKDKEGDTFNTKEEQMMRWVEHFKVLKQQPPTHDTDIQPATDQLSINCCQPTKTEISKAINILKNNKSPGLDNIPAEILKADLETST